MSMGADLLAFLPETVTLAGALVVFALPLLGVAGGRLHAAALLFAVLATAAAAVSLGASGEPFFPGIYAVDAFSQVLKLGLAGGLLLVLLLSRDPADVRVEARADVPTFLFLGTAGMMALVSATELLTLYVALEMSAYSLYVLVALGSRPRAGSEAAARYVLQGAVASAVTLYGLSLVYVSAGTTYLGDVLHHGADLLAQPVFVLGLFLALGGVLYKLAAFPFHAWAPDVYEGSPHAVAAFVGTASKVAAVGVLVRVATLTWDDPATLSSVLTILAVVSMSVGNLAALAQTDLKRLLGWSAIAHAGYVLVGVQAMSEAGLAGAVFYGLTYLVLAFCPFLVVAAVGRDGRNPDLASLAGLHRRSPLLALVLLAGMFGLAGIPPTPGFAGKWFVFSAALQRGGFWLVLVAAVNATVSLYYYLQVVKAAWQSPSEDSTPVPLPGSFQVAAAVALAAVFALGVLPGPLWSLAESAARAVVGAVP